MSPLFSAGQPPANVHPLERFFAKVAFSECGCWIWIGTIYKGPTGGYGIFKVNSRRVVAHRWLYEICVGAVPSGRELDHLCRTRSCVNFTHLEPVTHLTNVRRGGNSLKTECPQGHPYTARNTYLAKNYRRPHLRATRMCKTCRGEHKREYQERKRQLVEAV